MVGDEQAYHDVKDFVVHEDYEPSSLEYDFAIINLKTPVYLTAKVDLAILSDFDVQSLIGKTGTVHGWGINENNTSSTILSAIDLEIISNRNCEVLLRRKTRFTSNYLCGFSLRKESATCQGDSGGVSKHLFQI